jgi:hypothetical protein
MNSSRALGQSQSSGSSPGVRRFAGSSESSRRMASSPASMPSSRCAYSYTTEYTPGRSSMLRVLPKVTFSPATFCSSMATCSSTCPSQVPSSSRSRRRKPPGSR